MAKRFRNIVGPAVRRARETQGLTQEQLAARLGAAGLHHFDRVTVAKIEGQIRSVFDYELAVVARVLKVELGDLYPGWGKVEDMLGNLIDYLESILREGVIRITDVLISPGEKAAAWFSSEPFWEPTANKMVKLPGARLAKATHGIEEMAAYATPIRIEIDPEKVLLATWKGFRGTSGILRANADALEEAGRKDGADPDRWRASFDPVPESAWLRIQKFRDGHWIDDARCAELSEDDRATCALGELIEHSRMATADVILGIDRHSGQEILLYGRKLLEEVSASGGTRTLLVQSLSLDLGNEEELRRISETVISIFGHHDYA